MIDRASNMSSERCGIQAEVQSPGPGGFLLSCIASYKASMKKMELKKYIILIKVTC